jgi:hypothetical protein
MPVHVVLQATRSVGESWRSSALKHAEPLTAAPGPQLPPISLRQSLEILHFLPHIFPQHHLQRSFKWEVLQTQLDRL